MYDDHIWTPAFADPDCPAVKYIAKIENLTKKCNDEVRRTIYMKGYKSEVIFQLRYDSCDVVHIWSIYTVYPGHGDGGRALRFLMNYADRFDVNLVLTPKPYGHEYLKKDELTKWYEKYGFEFMVKGKGPMIRSSEVGRKVKMMIRFPGQNQPKSS